MSEMGRQIIHRRVRYAVEEKVPRGPVRTVYCTALISMSVDVETIAYQLALKAHKTRNKRTQVLKGLIKAELSELVRG